MSSSLDRKDYKTSIPQLSKDINWFKDNNVKVNKIVVDLTGGKANNIGEYAEYFQELTTGYFKAIVGDLDYLVSHEAYLVQLETDVGTFGFLTADSAVIQDLEVGNLHIGGETINVYTLANDTFAMATQLQTDLLNTNQLVAQANRDAQGALNSLADIENVIGALEWIKNHGEYSQTVTEDTVVAEGKWYFSRSGTSPDYVYERVIPADDANPHDLGLYELENVDRAIANYVSNHLALIDNGLALQTDGSQARVEILTGRYRATNDTTVLDGKRYFTESGGEYTLVDSPTGNPQSQGWYEIYDDGLKLIGTFGETLAQYGTVARIGDESQFHITIDPIIEKEIGFWRGSEDTPANKVAFVSGDQLHITKTVVLQQMDIGTQGAGGGQWSWAVHKINSKNNLYLKWNG